MIASFWASILCKRDSMLPASTEFWAMVEPQSERNTFNLISKQKNERFYLTINAPMIIYESFSGKKTKKLRDISHSRGYIVD